MSRNRLRNRFAYFFFYIVLFIEYKTIKFTTYIRNVECRKFPCTCVTCVFAFSRAKITEVSACISFGNVSPCDSSVVAIETNVSNKRPRNYTLLTCVCACVHIYVWVDVYTAIHLSILYLFSPRVFIYVCTCNERELTDDLSENATCTLPYLVPI